MRHFFSDIYINAVVHTSQDNVEAVEIITFRFESKCIK